MNTSERSPAGECVDAYLPAQSFDELDDDSPDSSLRRGSAMRALLVADDEPAIRRLLSNLLRPLDCTVHLAVDGSDAIEQFLEEPNRFCAALLDVCMPNGSGLDALDALRAVRPEMPVFLITGTPERVPQDRLSSGVHVIPKPFEVDVLVGQIESALTREPRSDD
jgi:CheY-like chemotaxis protein